MKRYFAFIMVAVAALFLTACIGGGGSSAPAPNNIVLTAKDSRVVVTWDMVPGVEYWVWEAPYTGTDVTPQNCSSLTTCYTAVNVSSPASISRLVNGTEYSFTINGRINGGSGGTGSAALQATPRLAGATWTTGLRAGSSNLRGVAYGGMFVTAGLGGVSFSSADGSNWTALPSMGSDSLAVAYDSIHRIYLSVGAGGNVHTLSPSVIPAIWAQQNSSTTNTLNAITSNGKGTVVAAGDSGTIITSSDGGANWATQSSITANSLYGIASDGVSTFVAVGASGALFYSNDGAGSVWTHANFTSPVNLRGVAYGLGLFVAAGDGGTIYTSLDGINWTPQNSGITPSINLNAVSCATGRYCFAVGDASTIIYSADGVKWILATVTPYSSTPPPLYAITTGGLFDYSAVGGGGWNLYAD